MFSTQSRTLFVSAGALVLLALAKTATALHAQARQPRALTGQFSGTVAFDVSEPRGDFKKNTPNGFGVSASGIWALDPNNITNIRAELGFLTYANSTRRIPLSGTGNLIKLDLKTSSNIFSFVAGPQLGGTRGPLSAYVAALGGFSVFWTQSSVEGTSNDNEPFASTTNSSDAALAYGGAGGVYIRLHQGNRPVRLELGARYLRHDDAAYLNDDRVKEAFDNNRDPIPLRGRADFMTYHLGVNVILF